MVGIDSVIKSKRDAFEAKKQDRARIDEEVNNPGEELEALEKIKQLLNDYPDLQNYILVKGGLKYGHN